jgi:DMSO/TMAO reductase YedYZ molybdopterin-dependent catalytic subunit
MRNASHSAGKTGVSLTRPEPDLRSEFTRRRFLFALGVGGAGAAAAAVSPVVAAPATAPPVADASSGYRETDHVRDYYDSARI